MEIEKLKPCPFCGGEAEIILLPGHKGYKVGGWKQCRAVYCKNRDCSAHMGNYYEEQDAIKAWNTRAANTLTLPARVGDSIVVKDGDSTDTLRIDGFELRGDDLIVWGEGENEHYVAFAPDEIIKYIPKEEVKNWDNQ